MTKTILLATALACCILAVQGQSSKKATSAYAITTQQKGTNGWKEVRLINLSTGEEIQQVYKNGQDIEILNPRTGNPVQKKDDAMKAQSQSEGKRIIVMGNNYNYAPTPQYDKPFATSSAAIAYDKKHDRLYYTPMGINQLRYIDLKRSKIYYFEDEAFGVVKNQADVPNQITRMVIASDGNGYALSNNAEHFMKFTTGKKPEITDLGAITDDAGSKLSIHNGVGGDMIADNQGNLYLITAYRNIFKFNIENKVATYLGAIKGLPENYQTNGAVVDEENKIIVCSGQSTEAYYRFDLKDLQAERLSNSGDVYNASDLANANLLLVSKKKDEEKPKDEVAPIVTSAPQQTIIEKNNSIVVYPNPVTDGMVKLAFNGQPEGRYNVQVVDLAGNLITSQDISINAKSQVRELKLPAALAKGNYMIRVTGSDNETKLISKLSVQ